MTWLLGFALIAAAPSAEPSLVDQLIAARNCRSGKDLGLPKSEWQTTYCAFKLKGLSLEVAGVNESGANLTVGELDPTSGFSFVGFAPGDECAVVMGKRDVALIRIATAKVYASMKECRGAK